MGVAKLLIDGLRSAESLQPDEVEKGRIHRVPSGVGAQRDVMEVSDVGLNDFCWDEFRMTGSKRSVHVFSREDVK